MRPPPAGASSARRVLARYDAATQRSSLHGVPEPVPLEDAKAGRARMPDGGRTSAEAAAAFEAESSEQDAAVDARVHMIEKLPELRRELDVAGDRLVILEVMAEGVCETGLFEPDDGWTPDREDKEQAKLAACESIRHQYVRMASDSPNVRFLETMVRRPRPLPRRRATRAVPRSMRTNHNQGKVAGGARACSRRTTARPSCAATSASRRSRPSCSSRTGSWCGRRTAARG